jgi:hypothetical protein
MVNGKLPLDELRAHQADGVLYLQGAIEVTEPGDIAFEITGPPASIWIDAEPFEGQKKVAKKLSTGRHIITLRIEGSGMADDPNVKVEITKPAGSTAQFTPVNGS